MFHQNKNKMYQLYGKNNNMMKKQSTIPWPIIIGCIVFTILCILITGIAILYRTSMDETQKMQSEAKKLKQDMEKMSVSGLSERYKPNDIDTIYSIEHIGPNRENLPEQDENTTKLTIKYMVIKGLKNKDIENDINSKISREMSKLYSNSEINDNSIDYINISGNIAGSYSNAISINLIKLIKENGAANGKKRGKSLNFDLATGNQIEFEDLFLPGVSIKNVLSQVIYDNLVQKNGTHEVEENVYGLLNKYENEGISEFYFDSSKIYFMLDNSWYSLPMWKFYDKIGIYKRFKTDSSIFDGTHEKNGENFVFQEIKDEIINSEIYDNLIAIIITPYNLKNKSEYFIKKYNEYYDVARNKIQALKKEAQNNRTQTIIYACKIDINELNNYWSFFENQNDIGIERKTNLLDDCEICEIGSSDCIIRTANDYLEEELLKKMYSRNYKIEKFATITKEELFALAGNKAKMESSSDEKTIVDLVSNLPVEDAIEAHFKAKIDEIKEMIQNATQDEDVNKIKTKVNEVRENIVIIEGKFANQINEKIKTIDTTYNKEIENIENSIYNLSLKRDLRETFENEIKELEANKNENNIEAIEERVYYLAQNLSTFYTKNKNSDVSINQLILEYSRSLSRLQDWAIDVRRKKAQEQMQNEINNTVNNVVNNTNTNNTTNRNNNTNNSTNNSINNNNTRNTPSNIVNNVQNIEPSPTPSENINNNVNENGYDILNYLESIIVI